MFWLIEAKLASAGKFDLGDGTPSLLLNGRALDASVCEGGHLGFQIVAHEIELVSSALVGGVDCGFGWRQREDQPPMTGVDGFEMENISEECSVCVCVFAVENDVSARDHGLLQRTSAASGEDSG
jgi:hypothetical protein